jgi:uncharacterized protein
VKKVLRVLGACALLIALGAALPGTAWAEIPSAPKNAKGYVFDYTGEGVLSTADIDEMNAYADALAVQTGAQAVAVLVDFLDGEEQDVYAYDLFNAWGIGGKQNEGVLLLMARGDRAVTIRVGTALDDKITAAVCGQILDDNAVPALKRNEFATGMRSAFIALCQRVARVKGVTLSVRGRSNVGGSARGYDEPNSGPGWLGMLAVVFVIWLVVRNASRTRYRSSGCGCLPFLLGNLLGSGMRGMFRGGSGFPPMGGFGGWGNMGGRSGPGGGFGSGGGFRPGGGFKPGGGSTRGGGASRKF